MGKAIKPELTTSLNVKYLDIFCFRLKKKKQKQYLMLSDNVLKEKNLFFLSHWLVKVKGFPIVSKFESIILLMRSLANYYYSILLLWSKGCS